MTKIKQNIPLPQLWCDLTNWILSNRWICRNQSNDVRRFCVFDKKNLHDYYNSQVTPFQVRMIKQHDFDYIVKKWVW